MNDTVHIACCFDWRMEAPFLVLANSIKKRLPGDRNVVLHAIHSEPLALAPAFFRSLNGGGFEVRFRQVENPYGSVRVRSIPIATLLRFMLPTLLEDVDRLLYLDTDIIALSDITPLYDTDLKGHAIGAVLDYALTAVYPQRGWRIRLEQFAWTAEQYLTEVVQLTNWKTYFNSGVLVMDLARFRKESFIAGALEFLERTDEIHFLIDQDSLNHVFDGAFERLDFRWNVNATTRSEKLFEGADPDFAHVAALWRLDPWIMHYCGPAKPWLPTPRATGWDSHFWREAAECEVFPILLSDYLKRCEQQGITKLQPAATLFEMGNPAFDKSQLEAHTRRFGDIPEVLSATRQFAAELDRASMTDPPEPVLVPVSSFKNKGGSPEGETLVFHLADAGGHIVYGPYVRYPPGDYEAVFEISLSPGAGDVQSRLVIEVVLGVDRFLAQRFLSVTEDICESSRMLGFTMAGTDLLLEFRIFADGFTGGTLRFSGVNLRGAGHGAPDTHPVLVAAGAESI